MPSPTPFSSAVAPHDGDPRFRLRGLDGLRALAVAGVVLFHLWPGGLPGGLIGVDVFFVISGYLITALLLREAAYTDRMRLPQFWMRRLRRLVPAMLVCVAACAGLAALLGGDALAGMPRQILSALTYTTNWTGIASEHDYFRQTSPELFTNFWSIAVEEQFYLLWPVVLVLTCMLVVTWRGRRRVPAALAAASILAMAVVLWATGDATRVYYGLDTHAFGLMLGAALALSIPWSMYPPSSEAALPNRPGAANAGRILLGWLSLALLVPAALLLSEAQPRILFPWGLLAASLLALGVIQCLLPDVRGIGAEGLRRLLSIRPLAWVGARSYGIYLWHWPLWALAHYAMPGAAPAVRGVLVLAVTVAVAAASYRWVENPVRRRGFGGALADLLGGLRRPGRCQAATALALTAGLLGIAGTAAAWVNAPSMTEAQRVVAEGAESVARGGGGGASSEPPAGDGSPAEGPEAYVPSPGGEDVTVVGDSVTLAAAPALEAALPGATVDAEVSRDVPAGLEALERRRDAGRLGRIVVVSLSTNSEMTREQIDRLLDVAEDGRMRQVVLVTGQAPPSLAWVGASNAAVRDAVGGSDRLVLADWAAASDGRPDLLVSDGVHPQPAGQELYARTVADAVGQAKSELQAASG
ncbi:acyltransferase family protein [Rothia halotolerans]|uniref:acyltransferase family protein n=1 Tax=Rothia halotolerans TaxID=405770 RepID=UPI0013E9C97E|nr:acyltransferase family protein [Rothia halotolerans]